MKVLLFVSIITLALLTAVCSAANQPTIKWRPCSYDFFKEGEQPRGSRDCATIKVPLDYFNISEGHTEIELIRAKSTEQSVKGSVLVNPGGPGESGFDFVAHEGDDLVRQVKLGGYYHVIGFDPRGTHRTLPFTCGAVSIPNLIRRAHGFTLGGIDVLWDHVKSKTWDEGKRVAEQCFRAKSKTGRFIGTTHTARDMLTIVDQLMEPDRLLNYWGISYGTVLGQVFASMFPWRVGRVFLDSNLLLDNYVMSASLGSPADATEAFSHLLSECFNAGPARCPLSQLAVSPFDLDSKVRGFFHRLTGSPHLVAYVEKQSWGKAMDIKRDIAKWLYSVSNWPNIANLLFNVMTNPDGMNAPNGYPLPKRTGSWNGDTGQNAFHGISCSDSSLRVESVDDLYSLFRAHLAQSSFADEVAPGDLMCALWKFHSSEKIDMTKLQNVKTKNPILFANGKYDPITPLSHAWEASARFRGSRVLVSEGVGVGHFIVLAVLRAAHARLFFKY
ncbi:hypothetical protein F66182_7969 [Fusarium sp. NRRL 66182]|nr:hypothetical protein F66182_7969 [Fusarium sp. NRRL 66182]